MLHSKSILTLLSLMFIVATSRFYSQTDAEPVKLKERNISGPRLGVTYVPGNTELYEKIKDNEMERVISQFGWHFEYNVTPNVKDGPSFVVQFIPLIGGVEFGKFIPSTTLAFGIRFPNGVEFGMGPNLNATNDGVSSSLVLAGGYSFDFGGVSIPLNLAYLRNPKGDRMAFVFGYALD